MVAWEILLFPALLRLLARLRPQAAVTADITPSVSFIITAHNEAARIKQKLANTQSLDYPPERLEVILADDGSEDGTSEVARQFSERALRVVRQEEWLGKTAAQNLAVSEACGEIVLFSDASALYNAGAIRALVSCFADPTVGCVTGRIALGEAAFGERSDTAVAVGLEGRLQYEQEVRRAQGEAFSLFGASGAIYAVRRALYQPLPPDQVSDLVLPLQLLEQGYRTVYEPEAVATLERPVDAAGELQRRSRIVLQCLRAMIYMKRLLVPWRAGTFVATIAWYRLLRWLLPVFLIGLLASNLALVAAGKHLYLWPLIAQGALYGVALLPRVFPASARVPALSLPFLFVWLNVAAVWALVRLARGEKGGAWQSARGK